MNNIISHLNSPWSKNMYMYNDLSYFQLAQPRILVYIVPISTRKKDLLVVFESSLIFIWMFQKQTKQMKKQTNKQTKTHIGH